jgi:endo-1,3(4)-beta-glucanase
MTEQLPVDMGFAPWSRDRGTIHNLSPAATASVLNAAISEVEQDFMGQCCLDSMYFSGKGLGKFAMMAYALNDLAENPNLARKVLDKLKAVFAVFVNNKQPNSLVYERSWKGCISTAGIHGDAGADFGNSWYNDHHFHYGYFVYTAAVIGYLDPNWLREGKNEAWVNMLVRDYANPICDNDFPFSRSFDWYHGHSWASLSSPTILGP